MQIAAVFFLASVAIGGIVYVFIYPMLSGERKTERRMQSIAAAAPTIRAARGSQKSRRDAIESSLKELDERQKKSRIVPLSVRIARAGLSWSKRLFAMISAGIGLAMFALGFLLGTGIVVSNGVLALTAARISRHCFTRLSVNAANPQSQTPTSNGAIHWNCPDTPTIAGGSSTVSANCELKSRTPGDATTDLNAAGACCHSRSPPAAANAANGTRNLTDAASQRP